MSVIVTSRSIAKSYLNLMGVSYLELVMSKKENQVESKTDKNNAKAQYSSPQLVNYGDIRELTLTAQKAVAPDNPGMEENMT
jgi:hypothetical protein